MSDVPSIDYTARDFASLRQWMLDDASTRLPEWTSRSKNDYGVLLIEEFAGIGDILSYYIDRVANESFLPTATQRQSLLNIAAMMDYRPDTGRPATVALQIGVAPGTGRVFIPAGTQFSSSSSDPDLTPSVIFETDSDIYIQQDPNLVQYGSINATQGTTVAQESLGTSDGSETQTYTLTQSSVIEGSVVAYVNEGTGASPWVFTEHLIDFGPADRVFTTTTDAFGVTSVVFGDNINGRAPYNGGIITATYRIGGGSVGNVVAGWINTIVTAPAAVTSVLNQEDASGGTDAETNDQIRRNAPKALSTLNRAVSLEDYANLCLKVAGVAKANAAGLSYTAITVFIAPIGGGVATTLVKERVSSFLSDKKMVNAHVTIEDAVYVPITITVSIQVSDQYSQSTVSNAVGNALAELLDFDQVDFAQRVTLSDVYRAVVSVPGVVFASVDTLARTTVGFGAADVVLAANEIPTTSGGTQYVNVVGGGITAQQGGSTGTDTSAIPDQVTAPAIDNVTCGTGINAHQYALTLHWAPAAGALLYTVVIDFFAGTTYVGSQTWGPTAATDGTVTGTFAGADTMYVHIQSINGSNRTDGPATTYAYPCG